MKGLAASQIAWSPGEDEQAADVLREAGFTGLEVAPGLLFGETEISERDVTAQRQRWIERGLPIVAMQSLLFGHPELELFGTATTRTAMLEHLTVVARIAGGLGARAIVFGSPGNRRRGALKPAAAKAIAVDFFGALGEIALRNGTTVCLEANAPAYGCDFVCATSDAVDLVEQVAHPGFRVQIDTSTMALNGEDFAGAIAHAAPLAGHFHISEPHLGPVTEAGSVPLAAIFRAARASGYDGWISLEMRAPGAGTNIDVLESAARAVAAARLLAAEDT